MNDIHYVFGDATNPVGNGPKIIAHVCNNRGAWGAGFTRSLTERWPVAEQFYRSMTPTEMELGTLQLAEVDSGTNIVIANMIAQDGLISRADRRPLRYDALGECLSKLGKFAQRGGYTVHMPRIGCGLAGGDWMYVGPIVYDALCRRAVGVTVYDLPEG